MNHSKSTGPDPHGQKWPDPENGEGCPHCGSTTTLEFLHLPDADVSYAGCVVCHQVWEAVPPGETYLRDGELMPWTEPCDNCAFRPGSPETSDKREWRALLETLKAGGQFFCHKGVPLQVADDREHPKVEGYAYPKREDGQYDTERMRLCRGFLNAWIRWEGLRRA